MKSPELIENNPESKEENSEESKELTFLEYDKMDEVREVLEKKLEERYGEKSDNFLPFHNREHSMRLAENSRDFLKTIQKIDSDLVPAGDLETAGVISWGHDLIQNSTFNPETGTIMRHRGFSPDDIPANLRDKTMVGNEKSSADEIIREAEKTGLKINKEKVEEAVAATYPNISFDPEKGLKIYQPYLQPESSVLTLAVAEGDLRGDLWSENFDVFKNSGNAEFRELNKGITDEMKKMAEEGTQVAPERKGMIAKSILDWTKGQIDFANSQKELFWEAIENNASINKSPRAQEIKEALKEKYLKNIERNAEKAKERHEALIAEFKEKYGLLDDPKEWPEKLKSIDDNDFESLLEEIGY
jgi:hypothetical protein